MGRERTQQERPNSRGNDAPHNVVPMDEWRLATGRPPSLRDAAAAPADLERIGSQSLPGHAHEVREWFIGGRLRWGSRHTFPAGHGGPIPSTARVRLRVVGMAAVAFAFGGGGAAFLLRGLGLS